MRRFARPLAYLSLRGCILPYGMRDTSIWALAQLILLQNQAAMKKKYRSFLHELAKTSYNETANSRYR